MLDDEPEGFVGGRAETVIMTNFPRKFRQQILTSHALLAQAETRRKAISQLAAYVAHEKFSTAEVRKCSLGGEAICAFVIAVHATLQVAESEDAGESTSSTSSTLQEWMEKALQGGAEESDSDNSWAVAWKLADECMSKTKLNMFNEMKAMNKFPENLERVRDALAVLVELTK